MIINFRQGIISGQSNFITLANNAVNINVDQEYLDIAFAMGPSDYLFSEVENVIGAWGPFSSNINYWLYWDINTKTGIRTYGYTTIQPSFGAVLPTSKLQVDQHFFYTLTKTMLVWNGVSWEQKLRVFAGELQSNGILVPNSFGTQVNVSGNYAIGYILYDINNNPITHSSGSNNYFVTTEDKVHTQYDIMNAYKIDGLLVNGVANEPIPAFSCLTWKGPSRLGVASYINYKYPCIGIAVESTGLNQLTQFVTKGFITNYGGWNWGEAPNTPLFVGPTGEITTVVPNQYSIQKIGHIVSPNTIFVDLQEIILIEEVFPTPTPSITSSITPSTTPLISLSPTPVPVYTVTPTPTPAGLALSVASLANIGISGERTILINFYQSTLCAPSPNGLQNLSITSFTSTYTQYNGGIIQNQDANCQQIAPTIDSSPFTTGTFDNTQYPLNQYGSTSWYFNTLPNELTNILNSGQDVVVETVMQTNVGQITNWLIIVGT